MFLLTNIIDQDIVILIFNLIYSFFLFYAVGEIFSKYFNFERFNFFSKINIGFLFVLLFNFFFFSFFMLFGPSDDFLINLEKIKEFFILFFLIFSIKNWVNINQKKGFLFFRNITLSILSLSIIFIICFFSEKNISWFNDYSSLGNDYTFYEYYYLSINIDVNVLEVNYNYYVGYYIVILISILIYSAFKSLLKSDEKNYFNELIILILTILFIYLININSTTNEYYLTSFLFFYSLILLKRKEDFKTINNNFNLLMLITIFLTFISTNWGIFYFLAFATTIEVYSLYKNEDIYLPFVISFTLFLIQIFFFLYEILFIYGILFLAGSILIFYYPLTSLFRKERREELIIFEEKLKKNKLNIWMSFFTFLIILNFFILILNFDTYFEAMKNLLFLDFSNITKGGSIIISILFYLIFILLPIAIFIYLIFINKRKLYEVDLYLFFIIIFSLFFNPFTITTFSIIFDLNLNISIYYLFFLILDSYIFLNIFKISLNKVRL